MPLATPSITSIDRFKRIAKDNGLPPSPRAVNAIINVLGDPHLDARVLINRVGMDAALTASVIAFANTDGVSRFDRADSLRAALANIGYETAAALLRDALTSGAFPFTDEARAQLAWSRIEEDAKNVAALAHLMVDALADVPLDQVRTFAVLRDCGSLALMPCFGRADAFAAPEHEPSESESRLDTASNAESGTDVAAREISHTRAGALLAASWGLDRPMVEAIRDHHDLESAGSSGQDRRASRQLIAIGLLADELRARRESDGRREQWHGVRAFAMHALARSPDQIERALLQVNQPAPR